MKTQAPPSFEEQQRLPTPLYGRLRQAMLEDLGPLSGEGDVTSNSLVPEERMAKGIIKAKQEGLLCGVHLLGLIFKMADELVSTKVQDQADRLHKEYESARSGQGNWEIVEHLAQQSDAYATTVKALKKDKERIAVGDVVAEISGRARALLFGERTALNLIARLCGIATLTHRYVEAVSGTQAKVLDTRKTTPLWRDLEKYAVKTGGGVNHRMGLYDMVLIKDNHLALWGHRDPAGAVQATRARYPGVPIEVEVVDLEGLRNVCGNSRPEFILLDNFSVEMLSEAVNWTKAFYSGKAERPLLEASGGISLESVRRVAQTGVDRVSVGALTHAAPALDLSMDLQVD